MDPVVSLVVIVALALAALTLLDVRRADPEDVRTFPKPTWTLVGIIPIVGAIGWFALGRPKSESGKRAHKRPVAGGNLGRPRKLKTDRQAVVERLTSDIRPAAGASRALPGVTAGSPGSPSRAALPGSPASAGGYGSFPLSTPQANLQAPAAAPQPWAAPVATADTADRVDAYAAERSATGGDDIRATRAAAEPQVWLGQTGERAEPRGEQGPALPLGQARRPVSPMTPLHPHDRQAPVSPLDMDQPDDAHGEEMELDANGVLVGRRAAVREVSVTTNANGVTINHELAAQFAVPRRGIAGDDDDEGDDW